MSGERGRLERMVERALRRAVGAPHPSELLAEAEARVREGVRLGVAPNRVQVALAPEDFLRLAPQLARTEDEIRARVRALAAAEGWRLLAPVQVDIMADPAVPPGVPLVEASIQLSAAAPSALVGSATETRPLYRPSRRWRVAVEGGGEHSILYLPFRIGRARDNDLVLPSPLVSRYHAEVVAGIGGEALLRDLNSRNGVLLGGERVAEVRLEHALTVQVGDFILRFEEEG